MFDRLVVSILVDEVVGGFFISVPPGHVAAVYDRGRGVLDKVWGPGLHLKIPFWQVAKLFNAQTLEYNIRDGINVDKNPEAFGDEPINAVTQDNRLTKVEGTILLKINKGMLPELWENVGGRVVSKIVRRGSARRDAKEGSVGDQPLFLKPFRDRLQPVTGPHLENRVLAKGAGLLHLGATPRNHAAHHRHRDDQQRKRI